MDFGLFVPCARFDESVAFQQIVTVPYYHPLRLAGEVALADHLTDGRLELGVSRGALPDAYRMAPTVNPAMKRSTNRL
jgi:alkanesulfonate monooxygenase SsuD/methylene tetrahydromethanopterin reductase-like flavin-dependent oxidoreductase (luciferase family)